MPEGLEAQGTTVSCGSPSTSHKGLTFSRRVLQIVPRNTARTYVTSQQHRHGATTVSYSLEEYYNAKAIKCSSCVLHSHIVCVVQRLYCSGVRYDSR